MATAGGPRPGRWVPPQPGKALPRPWDGHKERPGSGMATACRLFACPPCAQPSRPRRRVPKPSGPRRGRAEHRAPVGNRWRVPKPPVPRHVTAPSPGPRCHQETRDSGEPHAGGRSSRHAELARHGAERKAGNVPTSLGVTPHGVRDPGTKPTETTAKRNNPCHGMRPAPQQCPPCMV